MADQVRPASSEGGPARPRQAWLLVVAGALAVALWLVGLAWAFTRLYALNFSVRGPNATLLLAAAFVTAWAGPAAHRLGERWRGVTPALPVTGGGLLLASGVLALPGALLASLGALAALTPVLAALVARLRERAALAAALGVALVLLVRSLQHTVPPYGLPAGWIAIGLAAGCLAGCWLSLARDSSGRFATAVTRPVAAVYALVFVEVLFLGSAATVAGWTLRPTTLVGVASAVGLVTGGAVVVSGHPIARRPWTWSAGYLVAVVDLVWLDLVAGASVLAAQAAAVVLVWQACRHAAGGRTGGRTGARTGGMTGGRIGARTSATTHLAGVQVASVLLVLLYVSAVNAPYMPGPLARLGGLEGVSSWRASGSCRPSRCSDGTDPGRPRRSVCPRPTDAGPSWLSRRPPAGPSSRPCWGRSRRPRWGPRGRRAPTRTRPARRKAMRQTAARRALRQTATRTAMRPTTGAPGVTTRRTGW